MNLCQTKKNIFQIQFKSILQKFSKEKRSMNMSDLISSVPTTDRPAAFDNTTPGTIRVIRRNGTITPYDGMKISVALTKAFLAVEGGEAAASARIHEIVKRMVVQISDAFRRRLPTGGTIHIEDI